MSYLAVPTSKTEYGVVIVGDFINVDSEGIISIAQDLSPNASVTFANVSVTDNLTANGNLVVTSITPTAGDGILLSNVVANGYSASFTVTNTGVLSLDAGNGISVSANTGNVTVTNIGVTNLVAGSGISLSGNTGNITISSFGADLINVIGVTANYTATLTDEYIGVFSASAITITLPTGIAGRVYTIKDEYGQGSGKITIQPASGETIDGKVNYTISVPNQSVSVVSRASKWWII